MSNFALRCVIFAENQKRMDIKELKINPKNPRKFDKATIDKMVKSITEFPKMLSLRPIVIDDDGTVLGGNLRLKALHAAGFEEIPDDWVRKASELTEEEKKRFIIADNVQFGEWDYDELTSEWDAGQLADWGLELPTISNEVEAHEDDYEIPDEIKTDIVLGDLFEFQKDGKTLHRLLCGDSTDSDQVAKLMNGENADLILTDPPYGIGYKESKNWAKPSYIKRPIIGDNESFNFNKYAFPNSKNYCIWGANYFCNTIPFYEKSNYVVWAKAHSDEENKVFGSSFELCLMYPKHKQEIWYVRRINMGGDENGLHPTQKPIEVMSRCIKYHQSDNPINIVDLFLGSGTTMVAAHQLNRKCYGMELDPKYCQVIIDRMLKLDNGLQILKNGNPL